MGRTISLSVVVRILAAVLLITGCATTWFIWNKISQNHTYYLEKVINVEGNLIADAIESDLAEKFQALQFLSERYHASPREALLGKIDDWSEYLTNRPGMLTVAIVEGDRNILWNYQRSSRVIMDEILHRIDNITTDGMRGKFVSLPHDNSASANNGFLVLWAPVYGENQQSRRLMIVLRPAPWIRDVLRSRSLNPENPMFEVAFSFDDQNLFETPRYSTPKYSNWISTYDISSRNLNFDVHLRPTDQLVDSFKTLSEDILAGVMFLLFFVLSAILYMYGQVLDKLKAKQGSLDLMVEQSTQVKKALEISKSEEDSRKWLMEHLLVDTRMSLENLMQVVPHIDKDHLPANVRDQVRGAKNATFYLLSLFSRITELNSKNKEFLSGEEADFDLENLISSTVTLFRPLSERRNITVHYNIVGDEDHHYSSYPAVLRQLVFEIFRDILSRRENGTFGLLASVTPMEEDHYILDLEFTFQIDEQYLQTSRSAGGVNLNTELMAMMEATITEDRVQNGALAINIRIPMTSSSRKLPKVSLMGQEIEIPNMNILLVEDSDINQMIVKEMLTKDGHQVSICANGAEALEDVKAHRDKYDVILMDIQMPVMNGVDATVAIREAGVESVDLPIVAMTANTLKNQVDKYLQAGMQKILTKPIVHNDVRNVLASLILDQRIREEGGLPAAEATNEVELLDKEILQPIVKLMTQAQLDILIKSLQETLKRNVPKLSDRKLSSEKKSRLAHEIKGMTSNAGLIVVADIASRIEMKLLGSEECQADVKNLENTFAKSIRVLNEYLRLEKQKNTGARTS